MDLNNILTRALRVVAPFLCVLVAWPHVGLASTLIVGNGDPSLFAGSTYTGGSQQIGPGARDFTPNSISGLLLWLRADKGITVVQGPVTATGTTPPTVTLSGIPANKNQQTLVLTTTLGGVLTVTLFSWSLNGVTQQTNQLATGAFVLGTTGITADFSAGTYTAGDTYTSVLTVSAWADQSGKGNSATQVTAANQPPYTVTGGANGCPYLTFVGNAGTHTLLGTVLPAQPQEFFIVARSTASNPVQNNYLFDTGGNVSSTIQGSGTNSLEQYSGSATVNVTSFTPGANFLVDSYFSAAASTVTINGGATTGPANPGTNAPTLGYTVGAEGLPADEWGGYIYEVIVYNQLISAINRAKLLQYITARYGIVT